MKIYQSTAVVEIALIVSIVKFFILKKNLNNKNFIHLLSFVYIFCLVSNEERKTVDTMIENILFPPTSDIRRMVYQKQTSFPPRMSLEK
jgi:hypothetical protein